MKTIITFLAISFILCSCKKEYEVIIPDSSTWMLFNSPSAQSLKRPALLAMEGVYGLSNATGFFGDLLAVKESHTIKGNDTTFHISGFFGKDIAYFICEGKQLNGTILLNGYWRKMVSTETGIIRLTIAPADGANILLSSNPVIVAGNVTFKGLYGKEQEEPGDSIAFTYKRQLNKTPGDFQIVAHRSGGRTSDLLPVSENSVAMILKTAEFGTTGVEIDVRFTKDGVPILYHDNTLNLRVVQKSGLAGPIENYTYNQLTTFIRLIHGENIPTLREALDAVVYQTSLSFVWLDTKYIGSIAPVEVLQREFIQKAAVRGRKLDIVIGLPGQDQLNQFLALPNYAGTPSLCELSIDDVVKTNAKIWAPRFTEGTQTDKVAEVHAQGRKAFVWTLDVPDFIKQYIREGDFDGILSNYPTCVAYNYYVHE